MRERERERERKREREKEREREREKSVSCRRGSIKFLSLQLRIFSLFVSHSVYLCYIFYSDVDIAYFD